MVRFGGRPLFVVGLISSVACANNIRPIDCRPWRVFSIADVMDLAWKFPPWSDAPARLVKGLSVTELHSVMTCWYANEKSS